METHTELALLLTVQTAGSLVYYVSHLGFFVFALGAYLYLATRWDRAALVVYLAWFGWLMWNTYIPALPLSDEAIVAFSIVQCLFGLYLVRNEVSEFSAYSNRAKAATLIVVIISLSPFNNVNRTENMTLAMLELAGQSCMYTVYAHVIMHQLEMRNSMATVAFSLWVLSSYWLVSVPLAIVIAMTTKSRKKVEDTVYRDVEAAKFVPSWTAQEDKEPAVDGSILRTG